MDITLDAEHRPSLVVDLNEAEKILRINKWKIRAARQSGHLQLHFVIRRGEIVTGYSFEELKALASTNDWPSSATVSRRLGIPPYGIEQMCAMDDLIWAKAPHRTLRSGLKVDPDSVNGIERALRKEAVALNSLVAAIPLTVVMRGVGGREKAWGPVIRGLIEGAWPFAISRKGKAVRTLYVSKSDAEAIRARRFDRQEWSMFKFDKEVTQTDVCDLLNLHARDRALLLPYRIGKTRSWVFERENILAISQRIVTGSELCAANFVQPIAGHAEIRGARLQAAGFGFCRETAVEQLANHMSR